MLACTAQDIIWKSRCLVLFSQNITSYHLPIINLEVSMRCWVDRHWRTTPLVPSKTKLTTSSPNSGAIHTHLCVNQPSELECRQHTRASSSIMPVTRPADGSLGMNIMYNFLWQKRKGEQSRMCKSNDRLQTTSRADKTATNRFSAEQRRLGNTTRTVSCRYDSGSTTLGDSKGEVAPRLGRWILLCSSLR